MTEAISLERFALRNVEGLDSGRGRGAGAYGFVREVSVTFDSGVKIPCIAKRLHDILNNEKVSERERTAIREKFRDECVILSRLKHPNIVHFLGVSFGRTSDDLSLIMEQLDTDLYRFICATQLIPLSIQLSILLDVAYGLLYLHTGFSPPIIHRDLSASNVLISQKCEVRAKIADLGVAKLMDRAEMSKAPGTQHYMAPETLCSDNPTYGTELDVFSFGHLTLCTAAQKVEGVLQDIEQLEVLESIRFRKWRGKVQLLKRRRALDVLERMKHPLVRLLSRCLKDYPHERPTIGEIVNELQILRINHPKCVQDTLSVTVEGELHLRVSEEDKAGLLHLCQDQKSHIKALADEAQQLKQDKLKLQKVVDQLKLKQTPRAVEEQREGIFEKKAAELERRVDVLHRENRGLYNENMRLLQVVSHPPVGLQQARNSYRPAEQQALSRSVPQGLLWEPHVHRTMGRSSSIPATKHASEGPDPSQLASNSACKQEPAHTKALKSIRPPMPVPRRQTSVSEEMGRTRHKQHQLVHSLSESCTGMIADDQQAPPNGVRPPLVNLPILKAPGSAQNLESSRPVPGVSRLRPHSECDAEEYYNVADLVTTPVPGDLPLRARSEPDAEEYYNAADLVRLRARHFQRNNGQLMPEASAVVGSAVRPSSYYSQRTPPARLKPSIRVHSWTTQERDEDGDEYIDMSRSTLGPLSGRGST